MTILTSEQIVAMREGGRKLIAVFESLKSMVKPGASLLAIAEKAEEEIRNQGGKPSFKNYEGYPSVVCLSVTEQVVHCIPTDRVLQEGDILAVDMGIFYGGVHTDAAVTWPVGKISSRVAKLLKTTYQALLAGTDQVRAGTKVNDISKAIETTLQKEGITTFRQFVGHGIGPNLHENPYIPNFTSSGVSPTLQAGQAIAIEPITGIGVEQIITSQDGWSVTTADGEPSAHFEHTLLVTPEGYEILTPLDSLLPGEETLDLPETK
jgi:methionyl aminopeptidase